jgi:hypothetical protein
MKIRLLISVVLASLSFLSFSEDTPGQIPLGLAVGNNGIFEVSFPNMNNSQGCSNSIAFIVDPALDVVSKSYMFALLVDAKNNGRAIRVRLSGCTDRPKFNYVFSEANWL